MHRFGQKYDVVVVNFSNKGNPGRAAHPPVARNKFQLFSSVFGASIECSAPSVAGLREAHQRHPDLEPHRRRDRRDVQSCGRSTPTATPCRWPWRRKSSTTSTRTCRIARPTIPSGEVLNSSALTFIVWHELAFGQRWAMAAPSSCDYRAGEEAPNSTTTSRAKPLTNAHQYRFQPAGMGHRVRP